MVLYVPLFLHNDRPTISHELGISEEQDRLKIHDDWHGLERLLATGRCEAQPYHAPISLTALTLHKATLFELIDHPRQGARVLPRDATDVPA